MCKEETVIDEDGSNIIKGLALSLDLYADSLKDLVYEPRIHGTILECELVAIENTLERIKSTTNTLSYIYDGEISIIRKKE